MIPVTLLPDQKRAVEAMQAFREKGWAYGQLQATRPQTIGYALADSPVYLEQAQLMGKRNNPGRVDLPVGVSVFPHDLPPARTWADQVYPSLFYWNELDRGGHFASLEQPALSTQELRNCFRTMGRT